MKSQSYLPIVTSKPVALRSHTHSSIVAARCEDSSIGMTATSKGIRSKPFELDRENVGKPRLRERLRSHGLPSMADFGVAAPRESRCLSGNQTPAAPKGAASTVVRLQECAAL